MNNAYTKILMIFLAVSAMFSCTPESAAPRPTPLDEMMSVRVINGNPFYKDISSNISNRVIFRDVKYGEMTATKLLEPTAMSVGFYNSVTDSIFYSKNINLKEDYENNPNFTFVSVGEGNAIELQQMLMLIDVPNSSPNKADIRFINLDLGSEELDLRIGGESGVVIIDSVGFAAGGPKDGTPGYPLDEGNYSFALTKTSNSSLVQEFESVFLEGGHVYYLFRFGDGNETFTKAFVANGLPGDEILLTDPSPRVMFVNMFGSEESVDVYLNGTKGSVLNYTEHSDYMIGQPNTNQISVKSKNTTNAVLDLSLDLGEKLKKTVIGYKDQGEAVYSVFTDTTSLATINKTRIRFINMTDLPNLTLSDGSNTLIEDIESRNSSEFLEFDTKTYKFAIQNENGEVISGIKEIDLPANKRITFIAYKLDSSVNGFEYALKRINY